MKKIILIITILISGLVHSQEFKIKKVKSPQIGKMAKGETKVILTDTLITIYDQKPLAEFKILSNEKEGDNKIYNTITKKQKKVKITVFEDDKYFYFKSDDQDLETKYEMYFYY